MEITIQSVNFDTSESVNAYIRKKLGKLERFADNIRAAEVQLKVINATDKANKEIGIKLLVGDQSIYVSKTAEIYEDAISQAAEALERQLKRAKEKKQGWFATERHQKQAFLKKKASKHKKSRKKICVFEK